MKAWYYEHKNPNPSAVWHILITNFDCSQPILNSSVHNDKSYEYTFLLPWLGTGLVTATGKLQYDIKSECKAVSNINTSNKNGNT